MAIRAYSDFQIDMAMQTVGTIFEIALCQEKMDPDNFEEVFSLSKYTKFFECGNPKYNAGMSPTELLSLILGREVRRTIPAYFKAEFWCGYALAYVQWYFDTTFADLFSACDLKELLLRYENLHQMGIERTVEFFDKRLHPEQTLVHYRLRANLSQSELAKCSGVNVRNIKAYEQGTVPLSKASGETLFKLSRVLGCTMEDLVH